MASLSHVFKAYDIRGVVPDDLNALQFRAIGVAVARFTGAPTMFVGMLWPLMICLLGYTLAFVAIVVARTRAAVMERRIRGLLMARAAEDTAA